MIFGYMHSEVGSRKFRSPLRLSAKVGISLSGVNSMQPQLVGTGYRRLRLLWTGNRLLTLVYPVAAALGLLLFGIGLVG